ncbi:MAG: pilus assembly protein PilP [Desulfobacterales bacterium]|nr:pilus assembly protein PilP [Desulfobacterales bacterium]
MYPYRLIIISIACIISSLSTFVGCSKPTETIQNSSNVVSQKIIVKKSDISKSASPEASEAKVVPRPALAKSVEKAEQEISRNENGESGSVSMAARSTEFDEINMLDEKDRYNPEGKIDPFTPIFKNESKPKPSVVKQSPEAPRIPRGPLERVDLSQLKLVGIICAQSGNKALVEEASGKGYIITRGTRIGNRLGKVAKILADRVKVEEESTDVLGKVTICQRELKLQKPAGEE